MTLAANHWCNPSYVACIKAAHASEDSDGIMDLGRQEGLVVLKTMTITMNTLLTMAKNKTKTKTQK